MKKERVKKMINTKMMLLHAQEHQYAVPAFNIHNLETIQVVLEVAAEMGSPVILAGTPGTFDYGGRDYIQAIIETARKKYKNPISLHLDHHETLESITASLEVGTKSVMIDASHKKFEENIKLTSQVVEVAHLFGATVEAELGMLGGQEDDIHVKEEDSTLTDPLMAKKFVAATKIDSLAVAIGTAHGWYEKTPKLDFKRLEEIQALVDIPLVLHGASGIPEKDVQKAISLGICKVNIATELKAPYAQALRQSLDDMPQEDDPRKYLAASKIAMAKVVREKIKMCGSDGRF